MRMRRKPNLTARMEKCAHLLISDPMSLRGKWCETYGYETVHIEIGCGKGLFIAETAKNTPDTFFVALEKTDNVLITAMERALSDEIKNVRYISAFAENITQYFATDEVSRIYINFCDPWPTNRYKKRRLTGSVFLGMYKDILRPDGDILFKTDNLPLFEFSLKSFEECGFTLHDTNYNLHENAPQGIMTEFEQKFIEQGMPIYFCRAIQSKS